jgi:hypothetical protein
MASHPGIVEPKKRRPRRRRALHPERLTLSCYGERAVWHCQERSSGRSFEIHGPLAQILRQYTTDYGLTFLGLEPQPTELRREEGKPFGDHAS